MSIISRFISYIAIISPIFAIKIPILSSLISGHSVEMIIYYMFLFIITIKWLFRSLNRIKIQDIYLFCFCLFPFLVGDIFGYSRMASFVDFVLFYAPVAVYIWCRDTNMDKQNFLKIFAYTLIIGAIVSILVSIRVIETDIWAAKGQLVRAAGAVDSSLFIGGLIVFGTLLFVYPNSPEAKHKFLFKIAFVATWIGIIFSQSRMRIALAILIMIILFLVSLFLGYKSRFGNIRLILFLIICIFAASRIAPDIFDSIIKQIQGRYSISGNLDTGLIDRTNEIKTQMEIFYSYPFLGKGWGARAASGTYVHNIYSALLMHGGIFIGGIFIVWFLNFFINVFKSIKNKGLQVNNFISLVILTAFGVLGFTNAGIIQSGAVMSMMYVFLSDKHNYEEDGE